MRVGDGLPRGVIMHDHTFVKAQILIVILTNIIDMSPQRNEMYMYTHSDILLCSYLFALGTSKFFNLG
jgi:hypothetical protein